ncbi:TRAP transporter large permease [Pseudooctadecabacter jejudonensis]|uniref:TRAP transporter large permease protein n=1 Tax=Pseudooctadecabacter jejudonensis TaxID=1391910 RepID=A0A1Y5R8B3_9RHOB|nr:TRAP transporter large permease [Pseudooctadecabacter jejudonensis]SLN11497.1 Sialic acid TRAP transporter permease protein SiaT [Pseudooctadecabacter jejudonensis]
MDVALLFGMVIALLAIGVPIAVALGLSSTLFLLVFSDSSLGSIAQSLYQAMAGHYTLLAIPFFILASSFMSTGGVARRIIDFAIAIIGHVRGGLAIAGVLACMLFAALSGSSPATVVAVGTIVIAGMVKSGYSKDFAAGVICNAGTLGILIPPSIVMVVYASATDVSVGRMFLAGVIPGLLAGVMLMVTIYVIARIKNLPKGEWLGFEQVFSTILDASWGLFLMVVILGGIYGGVFTPTEAAAIASVYAFIVSIFIYRDMGPLKGRGWLPEAEADTGLLGLRIIGFTVVTFLLYAVGAFMMGASVMVAIYAAAVFLAVALVLGWAMARAVPAGQGLRLATGAVVVFGVLPLLYAIYSVLTSEVTGLFAVIQIIGAVFVLLLPPAVFVFSLVRGAQRLQASGAGFGTSLAVGGKNLIRANAENVVFAVPALFHRDTKATLLEAGKLTIMLMFIIANALILKHVLTDEQIPQHITEAMLAAGLGPVTFLIIVNIILLIGGQFMEPSGLIVIVAPLVFPIAIELGIDPIHLGIIMVVNMEIGMITPPVGLNLFVTSGVANMSMMRVVRAALPFLAVLFVFLIMVTYIPWLSTMLPTAYMGPEIITN